MANNPPSDLKVDTALTGTRRRPSAEEVGAAFEAAYESVRPYLPKGRNLFEEFIAERREAGLRGE